jgi:hypothetical protein
MDVSLFLMIKIFTYADKLTSLYSDFHPIRFKFNNVGHEREALMTHFYAFVLCLFLQVLKALFVKSLKDA